MNQKSSVGEMTTGSLPDRQQPGGSFGADGYFTLLLSSLVFLLSGGLYWCWLLGRVFRVARDTGTVPDPCDAITVLGMRLDNNTVRPEYAERLHRARHLFEAGVAKKILVLGGVTGNNDISEAQGGKDYLTGQGIAADRILLEDRSRHTLENLSNMRSRFLSVKNTGSGVAAADCQEDSSGSIASITMITSRFHLARSQMMADAFGIVHTLSAAEDRFVPDGKNLLRIMVEAYFIHWYQVGTVWSKVTRNRKSLQRIS